MRRTAVLLLLLSSACASAPAVYRPTPEAAMDRLYEKLSQAYARQDAQAAADVFAAEAYYLEPILSGIQNRQEIGKTFQEFFDSLREQRAGARIRFAPVKRFTSPDMITDVGYYELIRVPPAGPPENHYGHYVAVARPDAAGEWRLVVESYNNVSWVIAQPHFTHR